jgi:hypothetical protein
MHADTNAIAFGSSGGTGGGSAADSSLNSFGTLQKPASDLRNNSPTKSPTSSTLLAAKALAAAASAMTTTQQQQFFSSNKADPTPAISNHNIPFCSNTGMVDNSQHTFVDEQSPIMITNASNTHFYTEPDLDEFINSIPSSGTVAATSEIGNFTPQLPPSTTPAPTDGTFMFSNFSQNSSVDTPIIASSGSLNILQDHPLTNADDDDNLNSDPLEPSSQLSHSDSLTQTSTYSTSTTSSASRQLYNNHLTKTHSSTSPRVEGGFKISSSNSSVLAMRRALNFCTRMDTDLTSPKSTTSTSFCELLDRSSSPPTPAFNHFSPGLTEISEESEDEEDEVGAIGGGNSGQGTEQDDMLESVFTTSQKRQKAFHGRSRNEGPVSLPEEALAYETESDVELEHAISPWYQPPPAGTDSDFEDAPPFSNPRPNPPTKPLNGLRNTASGMRNQTGSIASEDVLMGPPEAKSGPRPLSSRTCSKSSQSTLAFHSNTVVGLRPVRSRPQHHAKLLGNSKFGGNLVTIDTSVASVSSDHTAKPTKVTTGIEPQTTVVSTSTSNKNKKPKTPEPLVPKKGGNSTGTIFPFTPPSTPISEGDGETGKTAAAVGTGVVGATAGMAERPRRRASQSKESLASALPNTTTRTAAATTDVGEPGSMGPNSRSKKRSISAIAQDSEDDPEETEDDEDFDSESAPTSSSSLHSHGRSLKNSVKGARKHLKRKYTDVGEFPCLAPNCGKVFQRLFNLTSHMLVHTGMYRYRDIVCQLS